MELLSPSLEAQAVLLEQIRLQKAVLEQLIWASEFTSVHHIIWALTLMGVIASLKFAGKADSLGFIFLTLIIGFVATLAIPVSEDRFDAAVKALVVYTGKAPEHVIKNLADDPFATRDSHLSWATFNQTTDDHIERIGKDLVHNISKIDYTQTEEFKKLREEILNRKLQTRLSGLPPRSGSAMVAQMPNN